MWLVCEGRGEVMARSDKCGCGLVGSPFSTVYDALVACGPTTAAFRDFVREVDRWGIGQTHCSMY